ncbi:Nardilysin [Orchesella cincta]|uniref:Nardilysin n=1 Tax=Orchesella cincta TaxID=48709 RepID=A0A1D2MRH0_ORCCI|nr:Nardilysin [Orchesella cincta]
MATLLPKPSTNQQQQGSNEKNSQSCKKCCKCPESPDNSKFQTPFTPIPNTANSNTDSTEDIIKSPLDERQYKTITLANGIRVMLISTYDLESYNEIDATKPPCQVPELAEFNKTYLGFDNPAARVKCGCPCDKRKPCCGMGTTGEDVNPESILKVLENVKATCCAKQARPSGDKKVSFTDEDATLTEFRDEIERQGDPDDQNNFQNILFDIMHRRMQHKKSNKKLHKEKVEPIPDAQPEDQPGLERSGDPRTRKTRRSMHTSPLDENFQFTHILKNFHNSRSYSRGRHCIHSKGTTKGPRNGRARFSSFDFDSDLDASAYIVIGAGSFDDPPDQSGLAHFCEHCLFLGSKNFPEPDMLSKLVTPFEGFANAFTGGMMTGFYTSTPPMIFPLAVEMLGDMVGFPLFPIDLVTAELEALDSEYSMKGDDQLEYFQLLGSLAKDGHAFKKMSGGNMNTLRVPNFYRRLIEWRRIYYNPKRMTVALEAPFPLDYLEELAVSCFGEIVSTALPMITNRHLLQSSPFDMNRFHQIYHVPSVYPSETMIIHWTLEAKAWKNLRVKPLEYLGGIMSQKGEGGLYHYLSTQGLATEVNAGCWESDITRNHFTSVFSIAVDMTEKGFNRQDNILQAIFGYIQMLINTGPGAQKHLFQELQKQALDAFHFTGATSTYSVAEMLCRWMQFIPPKWCLISPVLITNFDEDVIKKYTECLTVETVNVMIFSKKYQGLEYLSQGSINETIINADTHAFTAYHFPKELEEKITRTLDKYARNFSLPPSNPLLLDTKCSRSRKQDLLQVGKLIDDNRLTVSYRTRKLYCTRGMLPQARYSWWIVSGATMNMGKPAERSTNMLLMTRLFSDMFETKFYHTTESDVHLKAFIYEGVLNVILEGSHSLLPTAMEQLIGLFDDFENILDETQFEAGRTTFMNSLEDAILDNQLLAWDLFDYLWTNDHPLIFDHKRVLERLEFSDFVDFVKSFKERMLIDVFLSGYVTKAQGQHVVNALTKLTYLPMEFEEQPTSRCFRLPLGERVIRVNSQNSSVHTSVVINCYQFGILTAAEEEALNFLSQTMSESAFYQLRTEQQLGYYVSIFVDVTYDVSSIVVELVTQPKNFSTEYCNECIDTFLIDFYNTNLADEKCFQTFSLAKPKLELPFSLIQTLFKSYLLPNATTYRKLSIQVVGTITDATDPLPLTNVENIDNSTQRKSSNKTKDQDETDSFKVRRKQSVGVQTTIDQVKAAKKSMQMRNSFGNSDNSRNANTYSAGIRVKVVSDLAKFKQTMMHYPKLKSDNKKLPKNG